MGPLLPRESVGLSESSWVTNLVQRSASVALQAVWATHRSRYYSTREPLLPRSLSMAVDSVVWHGCLLLSTPWRVSRHRRLPLVSLQEGSRYYPVACSVCGNVCSSAALLGGGANYAGDYDAIQCGVCMAQERYLED